MQNSSTPTTTGNHDAAHRRGGMRRAWIVIGCVVAVAVIGVSTFSTVAAFERGASHATTTFARPIRSLVIRSEAGSVRVEPGGNGGVVVERRIVRGVTSPTFASRVDGDQLMLKTSCPVGYASACEEDMTIRVPSDVRIDAEASGGGIAIDGAVGTLRLRSNGGGVTVRSTRATSVTVDASGGSVRLDCVRAPRDARVRANGGSVVMTVPRGADSYRIGATSNGGDTRVDVPTDPSASRRIQVVSNGGGISIGYHDA